MTQTFSPELMQKKYESLPKEIRDAIDSTLVATAIEEIGDSNDLMLDQTDDLSREVGYVMLGLVLTTDFTKRLEKVLGVSSEKAQKIASDVNKKVFDQIRGELMKLGAESTADDVSSAGEFEIISQNEPVNRYIGTDNASTKPTPVSGITNQTSEQKAGLPMVEQMMSAPVLNQTEKVTVQKSEPLQAPQEKSTEETKESPKYTVDPYREPAI